ncbi:hypothetical protein [Nocardia jejuensis]|uniref:hypothetical protein n=1 Tax=Nocardia jejuensis TaxID=328049 RepID=UPI0012FA43B9|nr:hypothetical protein [Nocardia jejuensis]
MAAAQTATPGPSTNSGALSWMNIRDSSGVNLSNYSFVTDEGSILDPITTGLAMSLKLEFGGWMVIVVTGIWLIGFVLSFRWMELFSTPLRGMAKAFTEQLDIPIVLITAVSIGAFVVAWFVLRGFHSRAVIQVVTMIGVAMLGPLFLADPLGDVLAPDGWLSQGRDLGISIAAGLNGDRTPQPTAVVASMQEQLADNFARKPLQVWNFGHVIDDRSACRTAWSNAMNVGDDDLVRTAVRSCDREAYAASESPDPTQLGEGLLVLVTGAALLAFAVALAISIVSSAAGSIFHGFQAIVGFAAGGYIYGPTQTFLVRNVVHSLFAALRMAAQVIFLGVYVLFLGDIFRQAQGQVMTVFIMGTILEIVAISQLKRLNASLDHGSEWVANRFSQNLQGATQPPVGRTALGMGMVGAQRHGLHGLGLLATVGAINTVGNSLLLEQLTQRRNPARPGSMLENAAIKATWEAQTREGYMGSNGFLVQSYLNRQLYRNVAGYAATEAGGADTAEAVGSAIQNIVDVGGTPPDANGAMLGANYRDEARIERGIKSWQIVTNNVADRKLGTEHLARVVAAMAQVGFSLDRGGNALDIDADLATLKESAFQHVRASGGEVALRGGPDGFQQGFVRDYLESRPSPTGEDRSYLRLRALDWVVDEENEERGLSMKDIENIRAAGLFDESNPKHIAASADADITDNNVKDSAEIAALLLNDVTPEEARNMWAAINSGHAKEIDDSVREFVSDQSAANRNAVERAIGSQQATELRIARGMWTGLGKLLGQS